MLQPDVTLGPFSDPRSKLLHSQLKSTIFGPILSASILDADAQTLDALHMALTDYWPQAWIHGDIMDGRYVTACTGDLSTLTQWAARTHRLLDAHLMVENPDGARAVHDGAQCVTIHPDAGADPVKALRAIADAGGIPGLAISPDQDWTAWPLEWFHCAQNLTLMSVVPGKGGQPFLANTPERLRTLRAHLDAHGWTHITISVDGGITDQTAPQVVWAPPCWDQTQHLWHQPGRGADILVSGSFLTRPKPPETVASRVQQLHQAVQSALFRCSPADALVT